MNYLEYKKEREKIYIAYGVYKAAESISLNDVMISRGTHDYTALWIDKSRKDDVLEELSKLIRG